jgi:predicted N-acetyltransferase YhbS
MGRGIGRALFQHAAAQAKDLGFDSIKIEGDPNAEGFYERMGAVRAGTARGQVCGQARELPLLVYRLE